MIMVSSRNRASSLFCAHHAMQLAFKGVYEPFHLSSLWIKERRTATISAAEWSEHSTAAERHVRLLDLTIGTTFYLRPVKSIK